jgi:hypothetical protein
VIAADCETEVIAADCVTEVIAADCVTEVIAADCVTEVIAADCDYGLPFSVHSGARALRTSLDGHANDQPEDHSNDLS